MVYILCEVVLGKVARKATLALLKKVQVKMVREICVQMRPVLADI